MSEKELAIDSRVSLGDGNSMPLLGLGTWAAQPGGETREAVAFALETGCLLYTSDAADEL